jgi:hypothetical protein
MFRRTAGQQALPGGAAGKGRPQGGDGENGGEVENAGSGGSAFIDTGKELFLCIGGSGAGGHGDHLIGGGGDAGYGGRSGGIGNTDRDGGGYGMPGGTGAEKAKDGALGGESMHGKWNPDDVNADGTTIEVGPGAKLRIKNGGVTLAKIESGTAGKITNALQRTGDSMTGALHVLASASNDEPTRKSDLAAEAARVACSRLMRTPRQTARMP